MSFKRPYPTPAMCNARGWSMVGVMQDEYRKLRGYPVRQAVRYTLQEDLQLLAASDAGVSLEDLAADHQRGVNAIGGRIALLSDMRSRGLWPNVTYKKSKRPKKRGPYRSRTPGASS